jgi:hypothetical protein
MGASEETITLLTDIRSVLRQILVAVSVGKPSAGLPAGAVADEADLLSKFGDETVKFNPRDYSGEPVKGLRMSECPPEALDALAASYDYFAQKNEESGKVSAKGNPVAPYDRKSAARARGWAARIRAGKVARPAPAPKPAGLSGDGWNETPTDDFPGGGDDIPF